MLQLPIPQWPTSENWKKLKSFRRCHFSEKNFYSISSHKRVWRLLWRNNFLYSSRSFLELESNAHEADQQESERKCLENKGCQFWGDLSLSPTMPTWATWTQTLFWVKSHPNSPIQKKFLYFLFNCLLVQGRELFIDIPLYLKKLICIIWQLLFSKILCFLKMWIQIYNSDLSKPLTQQIFL